MHYYKGSGGTQFNYNSDLSGDVQVTLTRHDSGGRPLTVLVPGDDLIEFIGFWVGMQRIAQIEQMTPRQALGLSKDTPA